MRAKFFIAAGAVVAVSSAVAPRALARKAISEQAQRRALLDQLAAAAADIPPEEKTDADLMYEAMRQWRGEPRGSAAVEKVLAQSKTEIHHDRKALEDRVRASFWKDPFSSEVIPVRKEDRDLLRAHAARVARARGEENQTQIARLQDALATVRAENARLRAELARAEESPANGSDAEAQAECVPPSRHLHARRSEGGGRSHHEGGYLEAMSALPPAHHHRQKTRARTEVAVNTPPEAPTPPPAPITGPPAGWQSSDPRGIIVVPIEAPIPIHADKPSARAH